jgi:heptosyltransferase-1
LIAEIHSTSHDQPRVLIVRLSALGDVAMASPLIGAVRGRYPNAYIAWLAQSEVAPALQSHPELDELILWPRAHFESLLKRGHWLELSRNVWRVMRHLRNRRFDWALDPQGLLKSGALAFLSRAPRRIGVASEEGSRWLMTDQVDAAPDPTRISSEYLNLAKHLELPTEDGFPMHVGISATDQQWADQTLRDQAVPNPFIALLPFTTRAQKHWSEARWAELAERLDKRGFASVMLGGPADREASQRIVARTKTPSVHDWTARTSIGQAVATINRAAGVIGVDTGLTHIALARQRPTVCLFGSTVPYLHTGAHPGRVLYRNLSCSPCHRNPICGGVYHCMRQIIPAEVLRELSRIMDEAPKCACST